MSEYIHEEARNLEVFGEADVVVVGGGPAGTTAAVCAARNGANVLMLERYGHLGGMATGGIVIALPYLSHGSNTQELTGVNQEWLDRLDLYGGALHPPKDEVGSSNPKVIGKWNKYFACVMEGKVRQTAYADPEILKIVLNDMVEEAGVAVCLHSWGCRPLVGDGEVNGVVFESKEGRKAVLGKIVIDCTGDGDIFANAGAQFEADIDMNLRSANMAVVYRLGNVDFLEWANFLEVEPKKSQEVRAKLQEIAGFSAVLMPSPRNDVCWLNNWVSGKDCLKVKDLTYVEFAVRKTVRPVIEFLRAEAPGFKNAFLIDTAPQIGTRSSRRLKGEYRLSMDDMKEGKRFEDTVALIPSMRPAIVPSVIHFPYRALVPEKVNGLLVAGRCFSSESAANNITNLIPHCVAMGEAAGTAAAIAIKSSVQPRNINIDTLVDTLKKQGVYLP